MTETLSSCVKDSRQQPASVPLSKFDNHLPCKKSILSCVLGFFFSHLQFPVSALIKELSARLKTGYLVNVFLFT